MILGYTVRIMPRLKIFCEVNNSYALYRKASKLKENGTREGSKHE